MLGLLDLVILTFELRVRVRVMSVLIGSLVTVVSKCWHGSRLWLLVISCPFNICRGIGLVAGYDGCKSNHR
jgi:hypothetical protein